MQRNYNLIEGVVSRKTKTINVCKKEHAIFSPLISSIAKCIKSNSIRIAELKFSKNGEELNLKFSNDNALSGEILVEIIGDNLDDVGMPYYSNWDGMFYRMPNHKKKPFVKNGQFVRSGSPIGIVFINKNEQFILNAPSDGNIFFYQGDKYINSGMRIVVHNEMNQEKGSVLFCLK